MSGLRDVWELDSLARDPDPTALPCSDHLAERVTWLACLPLERPVSVCSACRWLLRPQVGPLLADAVGPIVPGEGTASWARPNPPFLRSAGVGLLAMHEETRRAVRALGLGEKGRRKPAVIQYSPHHLCRVISISNSSGHGLRNFPTASRHSVAMTAQHQVDV